MCDRQNNEDLREVVFPNEWIKTDASIFHAAIYRRVVNLRYYGMLQVSTVALKTELHFLFVRRKKITANQPANKRKNTKNYLNTLPVLTGRLLGVASCLHRVTSSFFLNFISSCTVELSPLSMSSPERASFTVELCNLTIGKCADASGNLLRISFSTLAKSLIVSQSKCLVCDLLDNFAAS